MTATATRRSLEDSGSRTADAALVAACLAGDSSAERELYDRHASAAYRAAFRLCGDSDVAADITQEAFVVAFGHLHQFQGRSAFRTWLIAIVASAARAARRKNGWLWRNMASLDDRLPARSLGEEGSDLSEHLGIAIGRLSEKLRMVFVMHDVEGFTHQEISEALDIPVGTSKARLFDARAKLRHALAHHWRDRQP
jgi:RNA polymerase sigma-70 factor, ECF subfamily